MNRLHVGPGLTRRTQIRLGHDFEQGNPRTVKVDPGRVVKSLVQRLAGILLEMGPGDTDDLFAAILKLNGNPSGPDDRQLILADLIALGQIRIEIIFARKHRPRRYLGGDGKAEHHRHAYRLAVENGQHPRVTEIDRAGVDIGFCTKGGGGTGENLAPRQQLSMNLESDNRFPVHAHSHREGTRRCQSVTC